MILTRCFLTFLGIIALLSEGTECMSRIRRQAQEHELDIASCDVADVDTDRAARCIVSPFRRFRNRVDGDLIAKYFSGGSLLGSEKSQTGGADSSSTAENVGSGATPGSNGDDSKSDSIVGASNSFDGTNSMTGKFLETAATWLQPQTLLGMRNRMDSMQTNMVGSPYQNTAGNSRSMVTADSHAYPAGMTPYSYVVGAPNPIYNYDTTVGTQHPSFMGGNYLGSSPYCLSSAGAPNNLELARSSISEDKGMVESSQLAEDVIGQSKPDPSLGSEQDTDVESKADLKTTKNEDDSSVVGDKQMINQPEGKE